VYANEGSRAGVGRNIKNGVNSVLDRGLDLDRQAHYQWRADHAGEVSQEALERAGEDEELRWSSGGNHTNAVTVACASAQHG
jgi:hypothetical protein